jgi:hypothetical protein
VPTRVLLEGPAIEPLLAQVRDEYGSKVRIISADKVRSGGVGGFFAKQHYELSVEVPDPTEDRTDMARQTRMATDNGQPTLERLLEQAEAQDRLDEPAPRTVGRPIRPAGQPAFGADEGRQAAFGDTGAAFAELMAGLDVAGHDGAPAHAAASRPSPGPKDSAPTLPTLPTAARGAREAREEKPTVRPFRPAAATAAPINAPTSPAPSAGFAPATPAAFASARPISPATPAAPPPPAPTMPAAAMPAAAPLAMPAAAAPPTPAAAAPPTPAAAAPAMPAASAVATAAATQAAFAAARPAMPAPFIAAVPVSPAAPPVRPLSALPNLAERIGGLSPSAVEVDEPEPEIEESVPVRSATAFGMDQATTPLSPASAMPYGTPVPSPPYVADNEPVIRNLMSVGMPEAMARKITGGDTYAGVLSVLAARPSAPGIPDGPGEILVLAGDVNLGVPIAKQLLEQAGVSENHLLLAAPTTAGTGLHSSRLISTPEAAESRVEKLHSADQSWIVVMDAPVGGTEPLWVNDMCDAIGATAVWSIVDATRKTADTARHLRTLGEVEALVVHVMPVTAAAPRRVTRTVRQ